MDEAKLYEQICSDIRATDEISFKLLGLVPLVSGTALITVVLGDPSLDEGLVVVLALFAAAVTLGIFRWELRNLQTCRWLIRCAEDIEERTLARQGSPSFLPRPSPPQRLSKRHAEKWIYCVTIVTWLGLPKVALDSLGLKWGLIHLVFSILLGGMAIYSLLANVEVPKSADKSAA